MGLVVPLLKLPFTEITLPHDTFAGLEMLSVSSMVLYSFLTAKNNACDHVVFLQIKFLDLEDD